MCLKVEKQNVSKDKIIEEFKWNLDENVDKMWNEIANCTERVAKDSWRT